MTSGDELSAGRIFQLAQLPEKTWHLVCTLYGQKTQRRVQKKAMASRSSEVRWNGAATQLRRSFPELIQIYSNKTGSSLKFNALVTDLARVAWLNATGRKRRYLADHVYSLLGFLPVGFAELEVENRDLPVDKGVSFYALTFSSLKLLEEFVPQRPERVRKNCAPKCWAIQCYLDRRC